MGFLKALLSDTHLGFMGKGSVDEVMYRKIVMFISSCWFFISMYLFSAIRFIAIRIFRIKMDDSHQREESSDLLMKGSKSLETVPEANEQEEMDCEEETSTFSFKFKYQFSEDTMTTSEDTTSSVIHESTLPATEVRKYSFLSENDFSGFMEVPEAMSFHVRESYEDDINAEEKQETELATGFLSTKDIKQSNSSRKLNKPQESNDVSLFSEPLETKIPLDKEDFIDFIEEPETMKFHARRSCDECSEDYIYDEEKLTTDFMSRLFLSENNFQQSDTLDKLTKSVESKVALSPKSKLLFLERELPMSPETYSSYEKGSPDEVRFLSEGFSGFDSDSESESLSDGYSVKNLVVDTDSDGFFSERDFCGDGLESSATETSLYSIRHEVELVKDKREFDAQQQHSQNSGSHSSDSRGRFLNGKNPAKYAYTGSGLPSDRRFYRPEKESDEMHQNLKSTQLQYSGAVQIESDSSDDQHSSFRTDSSRLSSSDEVFSPSTVSRHEGFSGEMAVRTTENECFKVNHSLNTYGSDRELNDSTRPTNVLEQVDPDELAYEPEDFKGKKKASETNLEKSEQTSLEDLNSEDLYELESLWEHQDLIEQLKMELKKVRGFGLPTILEESESPKTIEDLKPWKIDENLLREDPLDELHKFYKSYRERMRKFDILNYQKMYAIGFLQLKDPLQSMGSQKPLLPTIMSHLSQSFWPFCHQKSNDPSKQFLKELQSDLETVYVGQTCLSWEFLCWQYEKSLGLPETDSFRNHQYNQVAGEFQQFQVNIHRFIENESFQGPRLPNYVKNRCILRNLLQVPLIKEDCLKDKMEDQRVITSKILEEIMEESIRTFWKFVKADKNETPVFLKSFIGAQVELQEPSDFELMNDIQAILQKKEKKLKDILRTGNCLVKKFKKPREDRSNRDLFFSQIDLKLVSMVLRMSRITSDQLVWCHKKLNKIIFSERKVRREPSFLLFPC